MVLMWAGVWLLTALLIAVTHYTSRDPDSQLYAGIAARLAAEPVDKWIAPQWWGLWDSTGPFFEHPAGLFVLPATLARFGYPPEQSAYAVNALYQIVALCLIGVLAARVVTDSESRALLWLLQLLPIAFVFRVRANHEYAVFAALLFAVYAADRGRTRPLWSLGMLVGFCAVLLIKGAFAFIVPVTCAIWLIARDSRVRLSAPWAAIAAMPVAAGLVAWAYDAAYVRAAGHPFLVHYVTKQLPSDQVVSAFSPGRVAYNLMWYVSRVLWYAFPWSILAGVVAAAAVWRGNVWPRRAEQQGAEQQGAWFALVASIALVIAFSLMHRKADRYLIPVYFISASVGIVYAVRRFTWLQRVVTRLDRPWVPAVLFVLLCALRLASIGALRQFTFWRT